MWADPPHAKQPFLPDVLASLSGSAWPRAKAQRKIKPSCWASGFDDGRLRCAAASWGRPSDAIRARDGNFGEQHSFVRWPDGFPRSKSGSEVASRQKGRKANLRPNGLALVYARSSEGNSAQIGDGRRSALHDASVDRGVHRGDHPKLRGITSPDTPTVSEEEGGVGTCC
jgi:hypothetical protein